MPNYQYTILRPDGMQEKKVMTIGSEQELKRVAQKDGNIVIDIKDKGALYGEINLSRNPGAKELGVYCQQITSILKAGVPVVEALEMVVPTTKNTKLVKATQEVIDDINSGLSMSDAMQKHQEIFPLVMVQMVKAGEMSGKLVEMFDRLSVQFEKEFKLKNNIKKALSYPKMIGVVMIIAMIVVCVVVVPMFVKIFEEMEVELPFTTKIFIFISELFTTKWYILLALVVVGFAAYKLVTNSEQGRRKIAELSFKLPLIGDLTQKTESANFARIFSTMLSSGRDYPDSLDIAKDTTDNILFKEAVMRINENIKNGNNLADSMKKEPLFPIMMISMCVIGENTGNVGGMLENAAEYFEDEVETATIRVTGMIQPIIIVILGIFVGLLVYSIYSPMFSMYANIK